MIELSLQGHTKEKATHVLLMQERIAAHKLIFYYLSWTYQLSMNSSSEPTLSDHCPQDHKAPTVPASSWKTPSGFIQANFIWSERFSFMLFHTIAKNVHVDDFQEKNASGARRGTPPEVHQLLSVTWNYSASNLFWLTVPGWDTCGELHDSNWSSDHHFKSKHLPSRAFHCCCLQLAELFWFSSQSVEFKNR